MYERTYDGEFQMYAKREVTDVAFLLKWIAIFALCIFAIFAINWLWEVTGHARPILLAIMSLFTGSHLMKLA